jgi:hypothetical protein
MTLIALFAIALIGLLEYASRSLPHASRGQYQPIAEIFERSLDRRQVSSNASLAAVSSTPPTSASAVTSDLGVFAVVIASSSSSTPAGNYAAQSNYVSIKASTTLQVPNPPLAGSSQPVDQITSTAAEESYIPTASAASSNYISISANANPVFERPSWTEATRSSTQTTSTTSTFTTTDAQGQLTTLATAVPTTKVVETVEQVLVDASHDGRVATITWPLWKVFVGTYMPVLIAIIFCIFWTAIYNKIKLIEPFTHLARPEGVVATDALHAYYLSSGLTPDPIKSFFRGHWMVFCAWITYALTAVVPSLSTGVIFLDTNYECANPILTSPNPCWPPQLSVDIAVVRSLQALLALIAIMTLGLMLWIARTRTGISHDPSSIAAVAALVHHPAVLEDFRSFRDEAQMPEMRALLGNKRYKLDDYKTPNATWRYGIVPVDEPISYEWSAKQTAHVEKPSTGASKRRMLVDMYWDTILLVLLLGVLGLLIAYFKIGGNNSFNNFFNSNTFGPQFLMAALATIVSMNWARIEHDVQVFTLYHKLSGKNAPAPAHSSILLRKHSSPYTAVFGMLYHKHFFAAFVAFVAILSDVLIITLAAVPYSPGQVWMELIVCSYTSMAILGITIIAVVAVLMWRRQSPDLPRAPDTLMAVISYVANSNMLDDFEGLEYLEKSGLDDRVNGLGKRYSYGRNVGADGQKRLMVDEEFKLLV